MPSQSPLQKKERGVVGARLARPAESPPGAVVRSEEHTSELQSRSDLVCRLLLEKKKKQIKLNTIPEEHTSGLDTLTPSLSVTVVAKDPHSTPQLELRPSVRRRPTMPAHICLARH